MRTKLLYTLVGALLMLVVGGAVVLVAQGEWEGQQFEYLFVDYTIIGLRDDPDRIELEINGERVEFDGSKYQLFAVLGEQGWEYVGLHFDDILFKRPLP
jgi:hypothetical protein